MFLLFMELGRRLRNVILLPEGFDFSCFMFDEVERKIWIKEFGWGSGVLPIPMRVWNIVQVCTGIN